MASTKCGPLKSRAFELRYAETRNAVFASPSLPPHYSHPFRDRSWCVVAIPWGLDMEDRYLAALARAATPLTGDQIIAVTAEPGEFDSTMGPAAESLTWDRFRDIGAWSLIAHFDLYVFGSKPDWGVACLTQDVAVMAGIERFTSAYADALGGMDRVRSDFMGFAADRWVGWEELRRRIAAWTGWEGIPPWHDPAPSG